MVTKLHQQPIPENSTCPSCGHTPTDKSVVDHRLSANGYLHDDVKLECSKCGEKWVHGVPIGNYEHGEDLQCDSCDSSMFVHRVEVKKSHARRWVEGEVDNIYFNLHMKCPDCKYFTEIKRESDSDGISMVGYSETVGMVEW